MRIPVWLTLGIASLVVIFGAYRITLAFRAEPPQAKPRRGFYAMGRRTHVLIGVIYLLLGGSLVAVSFGWNPFAGKAAPEPVRKAPPGTRTISIDQLRPPAATGSGSAEAGSGSAGWGSGAVD